MMLPEMLAIELPSREMDEIAPDRSPLKDLLESATANGLRVTHDRVSPVGIGATQVTWTAWSGEPGVSAVRARRSAWVYVFPYGQTPIGMSRDDHATAGNNSPKVVRDGFGAVHAAWLDSGRPGTSPRVMYRRGIQHPVTGVVQWTTAPTPVGGPVIGVSYVGIAASERAIHLAWLGERSTLMYCRLLPRGDYWIREPIRSVGALGGGYETSPSIAVRGDREIHVLTATGSYAVSTDGGMRWIVDQMPIPVGMKLKNPAMTVDPAGNVHVAFIGMMPGPKDGDTSQRANGASWELRYVRRTGGGWIDARNVLAAFPAWTDVGDGRDVLSDWPTIALDGNSNLYVAWHGTIPSHVYGQDEAYLIRRPAVAAGEWGAWETPHRIHPTTSEKEEYSFAPSLAMDPESGRGAVVFFYRVRGSGEVFDSAARVFRDGALTSTVIPLYRRGSTADEAGPRNDLSSTWFTSAGPWLVHRDGKVWLDVLSTVVTPDVHEAPYFIVFETREIDGALLR